MVFRRKCPQCRARILVVVRQPAPATCTLETEAMRPPEVARRSIPLPERMERYLRRAGAIGMKVRDLQQRLQGPKSNEIKEILDVWTTDGTPPDYENSTVAAIPGTYGVITYVWQKRDDEEIAKESINTTADKEQA